MKISLNKPILAACMLFALGSGSVSAATATPTVSFNDGKNLQLAMMVCHRTCGPHRCWMNCHHGWRYHYRYYR